MVRRLSGARSSQLLGTSSGGSASLGSNGPALKMLNDITRRNVMGSSSWAGIRCPVECDYTGSACPSWECQKPRGYRLASQPGELGEADAGLHKGLNDSGIP